ncbi:MAG: hypothetical protein J1E64_09080 [Acetatifactor sp.]|nr:hypothetical protein [Acetatifactor sp.]
MEDISIDKNGKISGLPDKLCELLNSQESNGKYEQLRDDMFLLWSWSSQSWAEGSSRRDFRVKYRSDGTEMSMV